MIGNTLAEKSVLMRFSAGVPGESRKDKRTTEQIQREKQIGRDGGRWLKNLWPEDALKPVKQLQTEARSYHDTVTLPFGCKSSDDGVDAISGVGILPAALIAEYGEKMREFRSRFERLVEESFLADPAKWIEWAKQAHNGTFDASNYPGCSVDATGQVQFDADKFREVMRKRFYLRNEVLPVPNASHFDESIRQLLGTDAQSVDLRLADAEAEVKREILRRLIGPLKKLAEKLSEPAPEGKESPIFRDTLIGNVQEIVDLAPKLNISGDVEIENLVQQMSKLTRHSPDTLRDSGDTRKQVATEAEDLLKRLSGYKL